jgi:ectoine hydroxylase
MNIAVFLDEVMPINGPLLLIPGSHSRACSRPARQAHHRPIRCGRSTRTPVTRLCHDAEAAHGQGIVAPTGKPGSVLMFHGNLVHASPPNITPYPRKIVYVTVLRLLQPHHQVHARLSGSRTATSRRSAGGR